jgi:serine/threonine-protein kinase RsbW
MALKEIVVKNDLLAAKNPEREILEAVKSCGYCENASFAVKLALEEAITNAYRHGNKSDPSKTITVRYRITDSEIEILIRDEGEGFEPSSVPDPTLPENIDRPHGRGIMLMRAYLDQVEYQERGNAVLLVMRKK